MKVLIVSHTSLNTHNNMGKTFVSLFSAFDKNELCQLYIYPMLPDVDRCDSYFRITDKDVLKGYFKLKVRGREISPSEIDVTAHNLYENSDDAKLYRNQKNKTALRVLLRDLMWKFSPWYTKEVENWIKRENPTCMFVAPGIPKFLYDIAMKIAKKFNLPFVTYICDDFYFMTPENDCLEQLKQKLLVRKTNCFMKKSAHLIAICDEIASRYHEQFGIPATTVMTGSTYEIAEAPVVCDTPSVMTYMGNIRYDRYLCLAEIGRVLDELNREQNKEYELHIYTGEQDPAILSEFDHIASVKLCGFVGGEEFDKVFHSSQILIHTEAFDEHNMELTKNSVSTKIADSLASGIPLFAYGPATLASMAHLIRNDCAITATDTTQLKETLKCLFANKELRFEKANNGLLAAKKFHSGIGQSEKVRQVMQTVERTK